MKKAQDAEEGAPASQQAQEEEDLDKVLAELHIVQQVQHAPTLTPACVACCWIHRWLCHPCCSSCHLHSPEHPTVSRRCLIVFACKCHTADLSGMKGLAAAQRGY